MGFVLLSDLWNHAVWYSRRQGAWSDPRKRRWRSRCSDRDAHFRGFHGTVGSHWRTRPSVLGVSSQSYIELVCRPISLLHRNKFELLLICKDFLYPVSRVVMPLNRSYCSGTRLAGGKLASIGGI